ncbi:MATH domain/coiled-coil protein [Arabidopsis thaliana]|uniref:MATH domain and coiled-coil domain-containing protein At3g58430 n=1 Tax=Arabidopsis thaliana TaxID=3702 RepID=MCC30_ARATH|nr:MATH domain/coiled-coil protein [Arabidopsis thaliana]F4J5U9.2 RecName: Full=MATH domain and coiled-coil domain-containing protein At3g58430; AltName: Full=RTM3-like protein At3g58430 [Arabidopsis thaliana]ANM63461.1 MATH domain/coiled-coil protein [Arabidopsis thaliana]|eukprot:NP_001325547.1 MATH domain/coiled-coil protein [Arabidopsis thaliana]
MEKQAHKKFCWIIKNFSPQSERLYSVPVLIGDCKWRPIAYPIRDKYFSLCLQVVDFESLPCGWGRYVELRLTLRNQHNSLNLSIKADHCFDEKRTTWGIPIPERIPICKLQTELYQSEHVVKGDFKIIAEVDVFEAVGTLTESDISGKASELLTKKIRNDGNESGDLLKKTSPEKESNHVDVNGFQVLPSQVEYVRSIFERHPDIAVEFRAKNQHLRTSCMIFLLSLIETLCQSLEELSNEDLVEADIALTYVKDAGFKVDWLEKKLDQVKDKKEREQSGLARLHELEEYLLKLKQKCSNLDLLVEKENVELSATRTPMSFNDVV